MDLYVKTDGNKIVEACPQQIEGGQKITCTKAQWDNIRKKYDAETDGSKVTSVTEGDEAIAYAQTKLDDEAKIAAEIAEQEALDSQ